MWTTYWPYSICVYIYARADTNKRLHTHRDTHWCIQRHALRHTGLHLHRQDVHTSYLCTNILINLPICIHAHTHVEHPPWGCMSPCCGKAHCNQTSHCPRLTSWPDDCQTVPRLTLACLPLHEVLLYPDCPLLEQKARRKWRDERDRRRRKKGHKAKEEPSSKLLKFSPLRCHISLSLIPVQLHQHECWLCRACWYESCVYLLR